MLENDMFKAIVESLHEGVYFVDIERRITFWNKGAERITGYLAEEVVGRSCADNLLVHLDGAGKCLCTSSCPLIDAIKCGGHTSSQLYLHHKEGHRVAVAVSITTIRDVDGFPVGAVEVFTEMSALDRDQQLIDDLKREALIDLLTGLPNRRYLQMNLTGSLAEYERHGIGFGLVFVDVDNFKQFNDSYGHEVGDRILKLVGNSMASCMRVYDMVGRWGGEEFLAIIRFTDEVQFRLVSEKLRSMVEQSFLLFGNELLRVTVTLGATQVTPEDTLESLVHRADQLMYQGKQAGRNRVCFG